MNCELYFFETFLGIGLDGENNHFKYRGSLFLISLNVLPLYFPNAIIIPELLILKFPPEPSTGSKSTKPGPKEF